MSCSRSSAESRTACGPVEVCAGLAARGASSIRITFCAFCFMLRPPAFSACLHVGRSVPGTSRRPLPGRWPKWPAPRSIRKSSRNGMRVREQRERLLACVYAYRCAWLAQLRSSLGRLQSVERCWMYPSFRRCRSICLATGAERGQGLFRVRQKQQSAEMGNRSALLIATMRSATPTSWPVARGLWPERGRGMPRPCALSRGNKKAARREGQAGRYGQRGELPAVRRTFWVWLFT